MQSPNITKIATHYQNPIYSIKDNSHYTINTAQKRKVVTKTLNKNKILSNNKSIVKPSILNQPTNLQNIKKQKKAIRDRRRRKTSDSQNEEMEDVQEIDPIEIMDDTTDSNENSILEKELPTSNENVPNKNNHINIIPDNNGNKENLNNKNKNNDENIRLSK